MLKSIFGAAVVAALSVSTAFAAEHAKLEGSYTVVSGERDGKALPAEHFSGSLVVITADKIVGTDKDKKQFFSCSYKVNHDVKPMKIMMKSTPDGKAPKDKDAPIPETPGLIAVDGDTVKVIYALPGGAAPTDFKAGKDQHMFVLKRIEVKK